MCGPFAAAAAAASAAMGVGASLAGRSAQNRVQSAQNAKLKLERGRQAELGAEADAQFKRSLQRAGMGPQDQMTNDAIGKKTQVYSAAVAPGTEYLPGTSGAPTVIKGEMDRASAGANAANAQRAGAQARLDAPADVSLGNQIDASHKMDILGMLGRFRQGSLGVLPLELQAAQKKGGGLRMTSDLLRAGGQLAGASAAAMPSSNWFSPALNPAGMISGGGRVGF